MKISLEVTDRNKIGLPIESEGDLSGCPRLGLCINCDEAELCLMRLNAKEPIIHCEEYRCTIGHLIASDTEPTGVTSNPSERTLGLCINCDHAETCRFPKSEAGVWYCEEYE